MAEVRSELTANVWKVLVAEGALSGEPREQ